MFRCNHYPQGAHYLSVLKLHLLQQSVKVKIDCFNKWNVSKLK